MTRLNDAHERFDSRVEFIDKNAGGAGVRLKKPGAKASKAR